MASIIYTFTIADYVAPFLRNQSPAPGEGGVDKDSHIEFDLMDDISGVDLSTIVVMVDSSIAYSGATGLFSSPFNGSLSAISPTTVDGYTGYHILLDRSSEFHGSQMFDVRVMADDAKGNSLDETWQFRTAAKIESVENGPYEITLDVVFSEDMSGDLDNPANYEFSGNAYARLAEIISLRRVRLWVEMFEGSDSFTLRTNNSILDSFGAPLPRPFENLLPFQSTASISNNNGRIRTWRESLFSSQDERRIYLAGTKGIEIFDFSAGVVPPDRWAQIFDGYGVNAMFVAAFGEPHIFHDTIDPFLTNRIPLPGGSMLPSDVIRFSVEDEGTAVEIQAVAVFINGTLAFSGAGGGWSNGYSGRITVEYKKLNFTINPPVQFTPGTTISTRVIATDLLGNIMDEIYTFNIVSAAGGGFGLGSFGIGSFGGG